MNTENTNDARATNTHATQALERLKSSNLEKCLRLIKSASEEGNFATSLIVPTSVFEHVSEELGKAGFIVRTSDDLGGLKYFICKLADALDTSVTTFGARW